MRRIPRLSVLCLAAGALSACVPDEIIETTPIPTAGVRFINAVPDTGAMDFAFYDFVENSRHWQIAFRNSPVVNPTGATGVPGSTTVQFKPAQAGSRTLRIFMNGSTAAIASQVVKDTTVTLTEGTLYTAILWGYANPTGAGRPATAANGCAATGTGAGTAACSMRLHFYAESVTDATTIAATPSTVSVRIINGTSASIDAAKYLSGGAEALAPDAAWTNVPPLTVHTYQAVAAGTYLYKAVSPSGASFAALAVGNMHRRALVGAAAVLTPPGPFDALPGTSVAGSAVTGFVFPASVTGTQAPQGAGSASTPAWTSSALTFMWDRRPPRPAGV